MADHAPTRHARRHPALPPRQTGTLRPSGDRTSVMSLSRRTRRATFSRGAAHEELLSLSHAVLRPHTYLEIGIDRGRTLGLTLPGTFTVGVDPAPKLRYPVSRRTRVARETSDRFFSSAATTHSSLWPVDLAFIDGMHLFEYVLRDFRNVESLTHPGSTIIIDDCLPRGELEAQRSRQSRIWSGDVWKLLICLQHYRPDLDVTLVDASPAGLALVTNPNASSTVLFDAEEEILETMGSLPFPGPTHLRKQFAGPYTVDDVEALLTSKNPSAYQPTQRLGLVCRYWRLRYGDAAPSARRLRGTAARTIRRLFGRRIR